MSLFREISTQRPRALSSLKDSMQGLRLRVLLCSRRFYSYRGLLYITVKQVKTFVKAKGFFTSSQEKTPKKDLLSSFYRQKLRKRLGQKEKRVLSYYSMLLYYLQHSQFIAYYYYLQYQFILFYYLSIRRRKIKIKKKLGFCAQLSALVQRACQSLQAYKIELIGCFLLSLGRG